MHPYHLGQVPRHARTLIRRYLDQNAAWVTTVGDPDQCDSPAAGTIKVQWLRRKVIVTGVARTNTATVGFEEQIKQQLPHGAFERIIERPAQSSTLVFSDDTLLRLVPPNQVRAQLTRVKAVPRAVAACLAQTHLIVRLLMTGDPNTSLAIQRRMRLTPDSFCAIIPEDLFAENTLPVITRRPAVVIPVFNGFDAVQKLLTALASQTEIPHHLIIVDDGSDDPRIPRLLHHTVTARGASCTLITLPSNQGFVAAANAGIAAAMKTVPGHVVILNSDTLPPENWLARLLAPMESDTHIASVTPLSNAAEILSVPGGNHAVPSAKAICSIDALAQSLNAKHALREIPTGIGFCMGLNRAFIDKLGGFDPAFGPGYGEEVDWCQKARKLGGRHMALASLFVGHEGGASFGDARKAQQTVSAGKEISRRYPTFNGEVRQWCEDAPLAPAHFAVSLAWLAETSSGPVPIYLGHSMGGGAEVALQNEIAEAFRNRHPGVVVIRVGGPHLFRLELIRRSKRQLVDLASETQLKRLLAPIQIRRIVYSCGVGCARPLLVPKLLRQLVNDASTLEMRIHDYFPISTAWNLLDGTGTHHGVFTEAPESPGAPSNAEWRRAWNDVVSRCAKITVFSNSSKEIIETAYPNAAPKISVRPHSIPHLPERLPTGGRTLGILGGINLAKGGDVLCRLAGLPNARPMVIIGEMDSRYKLPYPHKVHGSYRPEEIKRLARLYDIGVWLMPSVCPETFSFTTHEMLATGLPVLAFDLGAQAEAVRAADNGVVLKSDPSDTFGLHTEIEAAFLHDVDFSARIAS